MELREQVLHSAQAIVSSISNKTAGERKQPVAATMANHYNQLVKQARTIDATIITMPPDVPIRPVLQRGSPPQVDATYIDIETYAQTIINLLTTLEAQAQGSGITSQ